MVESATAENGWVNTIDSKNPEVIAQARHIIESNLYCVLSTCSSDGFPWVSPVFFAGDEGWNIYWASAVASRHSQNLCSNNGRAAIAIFDSSVPAGTGKGFTFLELRWRLTWSRQEKPLNYWRLELANSLKLQQRIISIAHLAGFISLSLNKPGYLVSGWRLAINCLTRRSK
jgi:hypothetical protein